MARFLFGLVLVLALPSAAFAHPLILEDFFRGRAIAFGAFQSALDGSRRGITVRFIGSWDARTRVLTLREHIRFSDGETQTKTWRLTRSGPRTYTGTREDVLGTAHGFIDDQGAVRLRYRALVGTRTVSFNDLLTLEPGGSVKNVASLTYFFVQVGQVELQIRRLPGAT